MFEYGDFCGDFDCWAEEEIREQGIHFVYQLRHACNVIGESYVIKETGFSAKQINIIYNSAIHGSNSISDLKLHKDSPKFNDLIVEMEQVSIRNHNEKMAIQRKKEKLINDLKNSRMTFAGMGTNKAKRRLNKLSATLPIAQAVRLALEIEDKNISAKDSYGEYKDRIYRQKYDLITKLCEIFKSQSWVYGIQHSAISLATHVIYFEIPGCEQISWHISPVDPSILPAYTKEWDNKEGTTLKKLESITVQLLIENGLFGVKTSKVHMTKSSLAQQLRERQYKYGAVSRPIIDSLSDDQIIDSYITCSCCGKKTLHGEQLIEAIEKATDVDSFLDVACNFH